MINDLINNLSKLNLVADSQDEVYKLLTGIKGIGFIQMNLHPGKIIVRARPNDRDNSFTIRPELSYKPQQFNNTFQRASTPNQTMFYGGVVPEVLSSDEIANLRIAPLYETSKLIREDLDGEEIITFSKWLVTDDINMLAICYHDDFVNVSSHTKELNQAYLNFLESTDKQTQSDSLSFTTFLASEYAKDVSFKDSHFNYMISAAFADLTVRSGLDGIYYPSVKAAGMGFNVAITPNAVDSCLRLVGASECTLYKKGKNMFVDNETTVDIEDDTKEFKLLPINAQYHHGKDACRKHVGL